MTQPATKRLMTEAVFNAKALAQDQEVGSVKTRLTAVETLGGLGPGDVTDSTMTAIVANGDSAFTMEMLTRVLADAGVWTDVRPLGVAPAASKAAAAAAPVTELLNTIFQTPGTYYLPALPGQRYYVLDGTVTIGPNVSIICHPDVQIILKDFVRPVGGPHVHMFVTDPAVANGTVSWTGGIINSNEENQLPQGGDGVNYDVFKGMIFMNATKVTARNIKFVGQRGSAIEHWNISHFIADDIEVQSKIPTLNGQPSGGYRRGGITGSSKVVSINNVYGYAGDDLVCVLAGVDWGQPGKTRIDVLSAIITNIRPTEKLDQLGRGTWTAVTAYAQNNFTIHDLIIDGVAGVVQGPMVRVGSYAYGSDVAGTILNNFDNITIANVSGSMRGFTAPDGLYNGTAVPSVAFISLPSLDCRTLNISNVSMQMFSTEVFNNPVISAGSATIDTMLVRGVRFHSDATTVNDCPIFAQGSAGYVRDAIFESCGHAYPNAATYGSRFIYRSSSTSTVASRVRFRDCSSGDQGMGSPQLSVDVVNAKITPMSPDVVMDFTNTALVPAAGATFHDRAAGVLAFRNDAWVTVQERVFPYSAGQGKPTTGKWDAGFRTRVTGSPFKSLMGWVCTDAGQFGAGDPVFRPLQGQNTTTDNTGLTPTTLVTAFVPGLTISHEIGGGAAAGWPNNAAGIVTTHRGNSDSFSWQQYRLRDDSTVRPFRRRWDTGTSTWSAWSNA